MHGDPAGRADRGCNRRDQFGGSDCRFEMQRMPHLCRARRMQTLLRSIRFAIRTLWKSPALTLTILFTLALGIGANTTIFTLLYGLLLRSLPVAEPAALAHIGLMNSASKLNDTTTGLPLRMAQQFRRRWMAGMTWPENLHGPSRRT